LFLAYQYARFNATKKEEPRWLTLTSHTHGCSNGREPVVPSVKLGRFFMKPLVLIVFLCGLIAAQTPAAPAPGMPNVPDDTVIAIFDDGAKLTMGELKAFYSVLPPNSQQGMIRDRKAFVEQWALLRKLAVIAEMKKLDQASPSKEALEYNRLLVLSQAAINDELMNTAPAPGAIEKYYEANKERYKQVKVKAIYITFSKEPVSKLGSNGKPLLSEEDARAKAQKLLAEIRSGADFVKLVRDNSEDAASRDKDGDFATLRPTDNIPDAIKSAVFSLKQGEVSDPVQQPNGFYLLRAEEISYRTLADLRSDIQESMKQEHFRDWMQQMHESTKVQFPSPEFLGNAQPAAPK
jgi:peptidyl-prolyl cis-trans isomerase C